jgi:hypothetical protein
MRAIDADALIDDLKHDVDADQDSLDYEELTDSNREKIQFDKDCKQNAIDLLQNAPTIEPERKTGKWIVVDDGCISGKCSECGWEAHMYEDDVVGMDYCPNCGARLEGE